jgi:hypothetical protein
MIPSITVQTPIFTVATSTDHTELSRLLAAAIVNNQFAARLLDDPEAALANGYLDETFLLNEDQRALLISIRAESVVELAQQLYRALVSERILAS